ncbi:HAD-IA family hydrolase [Microvirga guangxiensis]|uniref:Phosphoglycolate phosphatase n=1 Tax=Microvirga guangxiensis TaxID=549386 RepID=A0A1G5K487_9HYPH|nr:HAD-IA family hydrolase [Microvirga guangxiensis]SCY95482.1 phosphoglycolate phosphatase [Microvirga guangxiensis]
MKLVLFDVDGTLVDSQNIIVASIRGAYQAFDLEPPSRERSLSIVGLSLVEAFTVLAGPKAPVEALAQAYKDAYNILRLDPANDAPLFPGASECIDRLKARDDVLLGLATGKSRRGVTLLIETHGWEGVFATTKTADDAPSKPHPAMILQAMEELGIAPDDTMMIGDSSFDMSMARAAGALPVGVSWGFQPVAALNEAGAARIVDSYAALEPVLDAFLAKPSYLPA